MRAGVISGGDLLTKKELQDHRRDGKGDLFRLVALFHSRRRRRTAMIYEDKAGGKSRVWDEWQPPMKKTEEVGITNERSQLLRAEDFLLPYAKTPLEEDPSSHFFSRHINPSFVEGHLHSQ